MRPALERGTGRARGERVFLLDCDLEEDPAWLLTFDRETALVREDRQELVLALLGGTAILVQAVLPGMRQRREGRIVNISSVGGKVPTPHLLPYVASKFALVGWSEGLHAELRQDGIVVTTVCLGTWVGDAYVAALL